MRDHLLNPNASLPSIVAEKEVDGDGEKIRIQMGVVQGVRDQLENALSALRAIGGDVGLHVPQVCLVLHAIHGDGTDDRIHQCL